MDKLEFNPWIISTEKKYQKVTHAKLLENCQYKNTIISEFQEKQYLFKKKSTALTAKASCFEQSVSFMLIDQKLENRQFEFYSISQPIRPAENILQLLKQKGTTKINISNEDIFGLINTIILKLLVLLIKRSNYQFFTFKAINVSVNDQTLDVQLKVCETSITGMDFLINSAPISSEQFKQIFQILQTNTLSKSKIEDKFNFQLKIRSIAKFLLTLLYSRNFSLLDLINEPYKYRKDQSYTIPECPDLLHLRKSYFRQLFEHQQLAQVIQTAQKFNQVNYTEFLKKVFVQQKEMEWQQVFQYIVPKKKLSSIPYFHSKDNQTFQEIMEIYQKKRQTSLGRDDINKLKQLGIRDNPKALFIAQLSERSEYAYQAICFDSNQLFYTRNNLDFQIRIDLFSFVFDILGQIVNNKAENQLNTRQRRESESQIFVNQSLKDENQDMGLRGNSPQNKHFQLVKVDNFSPKEKTPKQISPQELEKLETIQNMAQNNMLVLNKPQPQNLFKRSEEMHISKNITNQALRKDKGISQMRLPHNYETNSNTKSSYQQQTKILSQNFGIYSTRLRKNTFVTRNYYTAGYHKFIKRLK